MTDIQNTQAMFYDGDLPLDLNTKCRHNASLDTSLSDKMVFINKKEGIAQLFIFNNYLRATYELPSVTVRQIESAFIYSEY